MHGLGITFEEHPRWPSSHSFTVCAYFPAEELDEVSEANVKLKNGRAGRVTMHLIEGSKEEIEKTLRQSLDAFFEMYPEI